MPSSCLDDFDLFTMSCDDWKRNNVQRERSRSTAVMMNILRTIFVPYCRFLTWSSYPSLFFYTPTVQTRLKDTNSKCLPMFVSHIKLTSELKTKLEHYCISVFPLLLIPSGVRDSKPFQSLETLI